MEEMSEIRQRKAEDNRMPQRPSLYAKIHTAEDVSSTEDAAVTKMLQEELNRLLPPPATGLQLVKRWNVHEVFRAHYIDDDYRLTQSIRAAAMSLFKLHNETMNIWSHLLGFFVVVIIAIQVTREMINNENGPSFPAPAFTAAATVGELFTGVTDRMRHAMDRGVLTASGVVHEAEEYVRVGTLYLEMLSVQTYMACAAICLFLSSVYHWFNCLSVEYHDCLLKMDLSGVALLVAGSFVPAMYYGFYCLPAVQTLYLISCIFILMMGLSAPWVTYKIGDVEMRPFIFVGIVVGGTIPFAHWVYITPEVYLRELMGSYVSLFLLYGLGFAFYFFRFPERAVTNFVTNKIIPSHTLWHVCVVCAVLVWFRFVLRYRELLPEHGCSLYEDTSIFSTLSQM